MTDSLQLAALFGVGFLAQLVDGALGMAYGTVSVSVLLAMGIPPANASAAVHTAQIFTCGASGISHVAYRNVAWPLVWRLALPGLLGSVLGAVLLTSIDASLIKPFIAVYLAGLAVLILARVVLGRSPRQPAPDAAAAPLGFGAAFLDTAGGGGWGPIVTSTLVGRGLEPRLVVGSVNFAEFLVKTAAAASFFVLLGTQHTDIVVALLLGGLVAAPFGGYLAQRLPARPFMALIGLLVLALSGIQLVQLFA